MKLEIWYTPYHCMQSLGIEPMNLLVASTTLISFRAAVQTK